KTGLGPGCARNDRLRGPGLDPGCARNDRLREPGSVPAALAMTGFENRGSAPAARAMTGFEDRALRTPSPTLPRYCREGIQGIVASPCAREKGAERCSGAQSRSRLSSLRLLCIPAPSPPAAFLRVLCVCGIATGATGRIRGTASRPAPRGGYEARHCRQITLRSKRHDRGPTGTLAGRRQIGFTLRPRSEAHT